MTVVVDASVAVEAALAETWTSRWSSEALAAPTLLWSEATSALRQLALRGEITDVEAADAVRWLSSASIDAHPSQGLVAAAIDIANQLGWAKTYDAEYVALARKLDAPLLTADARLQRGVGRLISVVASQDG